MEELWKDVIGFEGLYQISSLGNIKSLNYNKTKKEKSLKMFINEFGYNRVALCAKKKKLIHRLVAEAFIPNLENKPQVNHKNGIRNDNRIENLEWVTGSENQIHAIRILNRSHSAISKPVIQKDLQGKIIKIYPSQCEASRQTGISQGNIGMCIKGRRNYAGGFLWENNN